MAAIQIRVHSHRFAVAIALPRNPFSLNVIHSYFNIHTRNPTKTAQNQKTYGRLLGMIFLEQPASTEDPYWQ
jgi:hypothetical protein